MPSVLVVEDEAHLADGLRFNLEAEGYEVEVATDGRAAVEHLLGGARRVDLVVLDLMLPEMGGLEVARRVRAAGNFVPILILTAKDQAEDVVRGIEEGGDDYLTKPFVLAELLARVRALLRRRRWDGGPTGDEPREVAFGDVVVRFDRFEIEDRGVGIPPGELRRIFLPFYRAGLDVQRRVAGLGLGLFIVRWIVQRHGGRVEARSEGPGRGSRFAVSLRAAPATSEPALAWEAHAERPGR